MSDRSAVVVIVILLSMLGSHSASAQNDPEYLALLDTNAR
jgi:hypothetical protein